MGNFARLTQKLETIMFDWHGYTCVAETVNFLVDFSGDIHLFVYV